MKAYRTFHDYVWPFISKWCLPSYCLFNRPINEKVPSVKSPQNTVPIMLPSTWAIKDVQNPLYFLELISKRNLLEGPDIYDYQSYSVCTERKNLHAFFPVIHDNDIYFVRLFYNVCFLSVMRLSSSPRGFLRFKTEIEDITQNYTASLNTKDHYGGKIALICLLYPISLSTNKDIKLYNLTKKELQLHNRLQHGNCYMDMDSSSSLNDNVSTTKSFTYSCFICGLGYVYAIIRSTI